MATYMDFGHNLIRNSCLEGPDISDVSAILKYQAKSLSFVLLVIVLVLRSRNESFAVIIL